ncbi:MAG TPA: penicillin-binding protein [Terriglobia bacterium]|jgi:cell division protein FtsI/penicillin-binding protein 2|nr:penicillin-binding protein [Terriglobia bacterium]
MPRSSLTSSTRARSLPSPHRRAHWLAGFLVVWMLTVVARLYSLQIIQYVRWVSEERKQQDHIRLIKPVRGTLYDRNQHPLAITQLMNSVYAKQGKVQDCGLAARALGPLLGLDPAELENRLRAARRDYRVKWGLSKDLAARVHSLGLAGIQTEKEMERVYPAGPLAGTVTGYTGVDNQGLSGVEKTLDQIMAGRQGRVLVSNDAHRRTFESSAWQGQQGSDVILTIDENITRFAEDALLDAVDRWHATGGTVIVEDPATGEILALVSVPTFDPNDYEHSTAEARLNRATQWVYEPGSVFKLVTLSAALDLGLTDPRKIIDCQMGSINLYGHVIHDHQRFGDLSVEDVLVHSSDVGAIKIGLLLGDDRFYQYIRRFGFGRPTGIELPREEAGLLQPPENWSGISVAAISMGQEISVTAAQLVSAYATIADGGLRLPPRLVREVGAGSSWVPQPASPSQRVVSERTAEIMKQMLEAVVDRGTGQLSRLSGYSAAGKTGTAQKIVNGVYSHHIYVDSFVGFAPVEHPALVALVSIDSPAGGVFGGTVAGPVFKSVMEQSLTYLKIPKDRADLPMATNRTPAQSRAASKPPQVEDDPPAELLASDVQNSAAPAALKPVAFSAPEAASRPGTVLIAKGPPVTVPDFSGLAVRPVAHQCAAQGLDLLVTGTGLAVEQDPPAGAQVPPGTKVQVRFAR